MTITYQDILAAKELLGLPERATMETIKSNYRKLLSKWHPDTCQERDEVCSEMTQNIIAAYNTICNYCNHYQYSFAKEEFEKYVSNEQWWFERFGDGH